MSRGLRVFEVALGLLLIAGGVGCAMAGAPVILGLLPLVGLACVLGAFAATAEEAPAPARAWGSPLEPTRLEIPPCLYCGNQELSGSPGQCTGCHLRAIHQRMSSCPSGSPICSIDGTHLCFSCSLKRAQVEFDRELSDLRLRQRAGGARRCGYCRDALCSAPSTDCPGCNSALHDACWEEEGGCVTLGCDRSPLRPRTTARGTA